MGGTKDNHAAEQVEPGITHHRKGRTRVDPHVDQIAIGGCKVFPRIDPFTDLGHGTENQGAIDRFEAKLLANEQIGQNQQDGIDDSNHHRQADVDAHTVEDVGQHDGETRDGAHNQLARNEEIIDANTRHKHAESHDQQLHPELFTDQSLANFLHYVVKFFHKCLIYKFLNKILPLIFEAAKVGILFEIKKGFQEIIIFAKK